MYHLKVPEEWIKRMYLMFTVIQLESMPNLKHNLYYYIMLKLPSVYIKGDTDTVKSFKIK